VQRLPNEMGDITAACASAFHMRYVGGRLAHGFAQKTCSGYVLSGALTPESLRAKGFDVCAVDERGSGSRVQIPPSRLLVRPVHSDVAKRPSISSTDVLVLPWHGMTGRRSEFAAIAHESNTDILATDASPHSHPPRPSTRPRARPRQGRPPRRRPPRAPQSAPRGRHRIE